MEKSDKHRDDIVVIKGLFANFEYGGSSMLRLSNYLHIYQQRQWNPFLSNTGI